MPPRRRRSERLPPTKEHVDGVVKRIRERFWDGGCPDVEEMPDTPAALMEWVIDHLERPGGHVHKLSFITDSMRDALIIHAYVASPMLLRIYDTGEAAGMKKADFSDTAGPGGSGWWTSGHQVHQQRHQTLRALLGKRVLPAPRGRSAASSAHGSGVRLVDGALAFLRSRDGIADRDDPSYGEYFAVCEDLEAEASPPPGMGIDAHSLVLQVHRLLDEVRTIELDRVMSGARPSELALLYTEPARKALEELRAAHRELLDRASS